MLKHQALNPLIESGLRATRSAKSDGRATLTGIVSKGLVLFGVCFAAAVAFWQLVAASVEGNFLKHGLGWWFFASPFALLAIIFSLRIWPAMAAIFSITGALCLGVICGFLSGLAVLGKHAELIHQAIFSTFFAFGLLLCAYRLRWINVNQEFGYRLGRFILLIPALLALNLGRSLLFPNFLEGMFQLELSVILIGGIFGVLCAAIILVDLRIIEDSLDEAAPKSSEWSLGFALLFDIVWMYVMVLLILKAIKKK